MEEPRYEVVWPLGRSTAEVVHRSERLPEPAGTTIGFIWDYVFRGDEIFEIVEREMHERYPDIRFVPYTAFGNVHGHDEREVIATLPERLKAEQVHAVIVGVGA